MKLGLALGYGGEPMDEVLPAVRAADRCGFDSVWSLEEFGADGVSILGYLAGQTDRIRLGTGILQIGARTPALTAMTAATLDILSEGRALLGLGVSQPWLMEGWHGVPFTPPVDTIREYVAVVRTAVAREAPLEFDGRHYTVPYRGPDARGPGRPIRSQMKPLRPSVPIYLGTTGPRAVRLTGEIADGWIAGGLYLPEHEKVCLAPLDEGLARSGRSPDAVAVTKIVDVLVDDDLDAARDDVRPVLASYIGPRGVGVENAHFAQACEMGWEAAAHRIREHHVEGRRSEAWAAVPDDLVDAFALVGSRERILDRLGAWAGSRVDTLILLTRDVELIEAASGVL